MRQSAQGDALPQVIEVIDEEAVPLLKRCSLAGHAQLKTTNALFGEQPQASDMLIDILTDRGFSVAHSMEEHFVPVCFMDTPHLPHLSCTGIGQSLIV